MKSNVAVMMVIVGMIIIHSEAASIFKTINNLPGGGPKTLMLNMTRLDKPLTPTLINMTTTESDFQGSGKREQRHALHKMIGGDGGRGSVMFLTNSRSHSNKEDLHYTHRTSTDETMDKYNLSLKTSVSDLLRLRSNLRSIYKSLGAMDTIDFDEDGQHASTSMSMDDALIDKYDSSPKTTVYNKLHLPLN